MEDDEFEVVTAIRSAVGRVACRGRRKNKDEEDAPLLILEAIDTKEPWCCCCCGSGGDACCWWRGTDGVGEWGEAREVKSVVSMGRTEMFPGSGLGAVSVPAAPRLSATTCVAAVCPVPAPVPPVSRLGPVPGLVAAWVVESVVLRPFSCRVERLVLSFTLKEENIA